MNLLKWFNKKPDDSVIVAKLMCGFKFLHKVDETGPVPFRWEAWLYENSEGKRRVVTSGNLKVERSLMKSLKEWRKHKVIIQPIPNHYGIITGMAPYEVEWTP